MYEPGTLDNTRKNIGAIDPAEAARMTKVLGGQIFTEKSAPFDTTALDKKRAGGYIHRPTGTKNSSRKGAGAGTGASDSDAKASEPKFRGAAVNSSKSSGSMASTGPLPAIASKENLLMDKLMMSPDFKIKQNLGLFNFIKSFKKDGKELVLPEFVDYTLNMHLEHFQAFVVTIQSLCQISPDTYKGKISTDGELKFRFLRLVSNWNIKDSKLLLGELQDHPDSVTVAQLIPLVKCVYKDLLKIYYIGETRIPALIKDVYNDLVRYPKADQQRLIKFSKGAMTEWFYLYSQVIKGMYPLLMRMCSPVYEDFPAFFTSQSSNILTFLGLTKFDLLIYNKKEEQAIKQKQEEQAKEEKKEKEAEEAAKNPEAVRGAKTEIVDAGLKLLNQLFPGAGFNKLDSMPDLYPYFQPLYEFEDGFNVLAPANPMQVVVVLLRILEDLFQGCRNIEFTSADDRSLSDSGDTLTSVLNEFSLYRENLFERHYASALLDFCNQQYSQGDFEKSLFGKKILTGVLWQTKFSFLPYYEFEQLVLEKPVNDNTMKPLCYRTSFLRQMFTNFSKSVDIAAKTRGEVLGVSNPWEKYLFDLPNVVSKRMDVLLGAKRPQGESAATNANLIKYVLCIVSVLDWWINNPQSPAYQSGSNVLYRKEEDGTPVFGVELRKDQNKLFAEAVKAAMAKPKA